MEWRGRWLLLATVLLHANICLSTVHHRYKRQATPTPTGCSTIQESCCTANLMDTDGRAMVEAGPFSTLEQGTYKAMALKFCFDASVMGQLWTKVTESTYTLYKQWTFTLTENDPQYVIVNFGEDVEIKEDTKFGIHVPASVRGKCPVPYLFNGQTPGYSLYLSMERKTTMYFTVGNTYTYDDLTWPRSYSISNTVLLCTEEDCADKQDIIQTTVRGPPGPPGPKGTKGDPGDGLSPDAVPGLDCDATQGVYGSLSQIQAGSNNVQKQLSQVLDLISKPNEPTGYCPIPFKSGSFGLGKCYMVVRNKRPFGGAQFNCLEFGSRLVAIESEKEHQFIQTLLAEEKINPSEVFWTSGMFSPAGKRWVWYDENTATKKDLSVLHWAPGQPSEYSGYLNCLAMLLQPNNSIAWYAADCPLRSYSVCEREKECY